MGGLDLGKLKSLDKKNRKMRNTSSGTNSNTSKNQAEDEYKVLDLWM